MWKYLPWLGALLLVGCTMDTEPVGASSASLRPSTCFVTGGGVLTNDDSFGGNAHNQRLVGTIGSWEHITAAGDVLECRVTDLDCYANGGGGAGVPQSVTNLATLEADCTLNGEAGYTLGLFVADRGEPNTRDEYSVSVVAPDGSIAYDSIDTLLAHGNLQIHGSNGGNI